MEDIENRKVRVIFRKTVYLKDRPYVIPIVKDANGWRTGQKLTVEKMLNPEKMTDEEKLMYPFVINPTDHYKVNQGQWLSLAKDYDNAMYQLLVLSGQWAIGVNAYEDAKGSFVGYLEDKEKEAQSKNKFRDERFEAETLIHDSLLTDYRKVALMLNVQIKDFNANIDFMKEDELKDKILEACETNPKLVKKCFPKYNPGVEFDYFILECIHYGILNQKPNGDIFDGSEFIGTSVDDIKRVLVKKENEYKKIKWGKSLNEKKGIKVTMENTDKNVQEAQMANAVKLALFDKDTEEVERTLLILKKYYPACDKIKIFENHLGSLKVSSVHEIYTPSENENENENKNKIFTSSSSVLPEPGKKDDSKIDKDKDENRIAGDISLFRKGLQVKTLDALQKTIAHHKSKYDAESVKSLWEDKDALIDYMVKIRFNL